MTKDEALKLALSTLDEVRQETFRLIRDGQTLYAEDKVWSTIIFIKEVLAQEQEPVAWMHPDGRLWTFGKGFDKSTFTIPLYTTPPQRKPEQEPVAWWNDTGTHIDLNVSGRGTPLYTHPLQRTWVGLTAKEKHEFRYSHMTTADFIENIEAKLREKNGGNHGS